MDESGDPGHSLNPSNRFFSMTALTGNSGQAEQVRQVSNVIQDSLKSSHSTRIPREFKWHHMDDSRKMKVLGQLAQTPLRFFSVVYDKPRCRRDFPEYLATSNALYRHAFETLCGAVGKQFNGHLEFRIDRSTQDGIEPEIIRAAVSIDSLPPSASETFDGIARTFKVPVKDSRITRRTAIFVDSHGDPGIQLADFIAGGIRHWSANPTHPLRERLRPIEGAIVQIPIDSPGETGMPTVLKAEAPMNSTGTSHFAGSDFKFDPQDAPPRRKRRKEQKG